MKKNLFLMMTVLSMMLSSCGGSLKPADPAITYTPFKAGSSLENNYVNVPVKGGFEIVSVAATIVPNDEYPNLYSMIKATINVKTLTTPVSDGHSLLGDCTIQLLDENNAVIAKTSWGISGRSELFNSEAGDVTTLSADIGDEWSDSTAKEMLAKVKYIRLAGVGCGYEKEKSNNDVLTMSEAPAEEKSNDMVIPSESATSSEDWNAVLNSYDNYVTRYIELFRKAQNGDMGALSEYPEMMQQAQNLSEKLINAQGTMSESQRNRYIQITNRMASEIAN